MYKYFFPAECDRYFTEFHTQFQKQTKAKCNTCGIQCKDFLVLSNIILQYRKTCVSLLNTVVFGLGNAKKTIGCAA